MSVNMSNRLGDFTTISVPIGRLGLVLYQLPDGTSSVGHTSRKIMDRRGLMGSSQSSLIILEDIRFQTDNFNKNSNSSKYSPTIRVIFLC